MLKKINNLINSYKKKARVLIPYHFDRIRGKNVFNANCYGVPLTMYADMPYQHHILRTQRHSRYEPHILKEWKELCKDKKCILDIGAYNGLFGIIAAKLNPNAQVFIFEPDETNFRHMSKNVELNNLPNVTPLKIALSDNDGEVIFGGHDGGTGPKIGKGSQRVQAMSMDSFLKKHAITPDLMKIDVEGAETMLFQGAKGFLTGESKTQILLEVHFNFLKNFNSSDEELFNVIVSYGNFERKDLENPSYATYTVSLQKL